MDQYIYRGQSEEEFGKEFMHNVRCDNLSDVQDDSFVENPYGTIVVPKDYDTCWIAKRNYYLGWKVVVAPVAIQYIRED